IGGARTSRVLAVGAGVFLVSCAVAGLQHFGVWPSSDAMRALAFTKIPFDRVYEAVPGAEGRFMAGGLLFHRLKFAHVGGLAVVGLLAFALRSTGRTRARLLTAAALGMGAILMFPFARAASAALAGASLLVLVLASRRRRQALVLGSVLVVLGAAAVASQGPLRARFLSSFESDGNGDRTSLLKAGVSVVRAHPLSGVGAGRFKVRDWAPEQASDHVRSHPGMAHNQLLSMAAQVGVPGALLFLFLLAWLVRKLDATRPEGIASLGALAFFVLLSGVHDPLFHAPFSMALPLMLGLGAYRRA
ncbi:MAG: O-antigen ligase family protein, partial [Myxococcaceae bacterium]